MLMAVNPRSATKLLKYVSRTIQIRLLSASSAASSCIYLRGDNPQLDAEKLHQCNMTCWLPYTRRSIEAGLPLEARAVKGGRAFAPRPLEETRSPRSKR